MEGGRGVTLGEMCEDPGNTGKSGQERVPELPDHPQEREMRGERVGSWELGRSQGFTPWQWEATIGLRARGGPQEPAPLKLS